MRRRTQRRHAPELRFCVTGDEPPLPVVAVGRRAQFADHRGRRRDHALEEQVKWPPISSKALKQCMQTVAMNVGAAVDQEMSVQFGLMLDYAMMQMEYTDIVPVIDYGSCVLLQFVLLLFVYRSSVLYCIFQGLGTGTRNSRRDLPDGCGCPMPDQHTSWTGRVTREPLFATSA
ncbi:hypothetical protein ON010_g607 [Phytophthora cinnamomi]|nr:hypothetical protein ON010_g607 [Phytophthora cinnamomi]